MLKRKKKAAEDQKEVEKLKGIILAGHEKEKKAAEKKAETKEKHGTANKAMLELVVSVVFACGLVGIIIFGGCTLDITLISYLTPAIS